MKGTSDIISAVHHLVMAKEHWLSFTREHSESKGARLFEQYVKKVDWILTDLMTNPYLPQSVRNGLRAEISSDVFAIPAMSDKISLLNPEQREALEKVVDVLLTGEQLIIQEAD